MQVYVKDWPQCDATRCKLCDCGIEFMQWRYSTVSLSDDLYAHDTG